LKNILISKLAIFTAALWWGSLTTLGFFVVPMLFQHLPTKALAGSMAARLFEVQTWVSVACGLVLLVLLRLNSSKNPKKIENVNFEDRNTPADVSIQYFAILFVALGMLMALLVTFGISPRIVARENMMLWHAVGTLMYLAQWLCAGVVLWKLSNTKKLL
jgi:NADH:ubiquinone oxidoreductase subunit 3 (subunit A)